MFFVRVVLGPLLYVPTEYVMEYVKKLHKTLRNQKMAREDGVGRGGSWMYAEHQLLAIRLRQNLSAFALGQDWTRL